MDILNIKDFDPYIQLDVTCNCFIIGKRASGKTSVLKDLILHLRDKFIKNGVLISPHEKFEGKFRNVILNEFVFNKYNSGIISGCLDRQRHIGDMKTPSFIAFDDCFPGGRKDFTSDLMRYRIYNFFSLLVNEAFQIPPMFRENSDFVFVFWDPIPRNREILYQKFLTMIPTKTQFDELMHRLRLMGKFACLVVDNRSFSQFPTNVFWYKTNIHALDLNLTQPAYMVYLQQIVPILTDFVETHLTKDLYRIVGHYVFGDQEWPTRIVNTLSLDKSIENS